MEQLRKTFGYVVGASCFTHLNAKVANPHATEDEVIAAASASGLLELLGLAEGSSAPKTPRASFKRSKGARHKTPSRSMSSESDSDEAELGSLGDLNTLNEPYGSRFAADMDSQCALVLFFPSRTHRSSRE